MKPDGRSAWKRFAVEAVVIVASILIAFAIDAAWDERNDRVQERAYLRALADDFEVARADLERVTSIHEVILNSADRLLSWEPADRTPEHLDVIDASFAALLANPTFDPPMGTVETVLGSGRIDLLRNQELVRELTRWSAVVQDLQEDQDAANAHLERTLYPVLVANLSLKDVVKRGPYVWPGDKLQTDARPLITRRDFQSILYRHWALHKNVIADGVPRVSESIERVRRAVDAAVAR